MSEDHQELLNRVARKDVAALGEIYDCHVACIYGLIARMIPSRADAEKILQKVFIRLWHESQSLSEEGRSMAAWLVLTARAEAVHRLRELRDVGPIESAQSREAKRGKGPDPHARSNTAVRTPAAPKFEDGKDPAPAPRRGHAAPSPVSARIRPAWLPESQHVSLLDERLPLLHKTMNQLPKPQSQALEMAVFEGLTEAEIAVEMGEPLAKAQRSLRSAVAFLKHRRRAVFGTWAANI